MASAAAPIRLAIVDNNDGQIELLSRRLQAIAWPHRMLGSPVPADTLAAMRLDAIVIDLAALGPQAWSYLEHVCYRIPHLGVLVHTEQSTVAQRVRALRLGADDWVSKPCHAEELIARIEAVVRRRRRSNEITSPPVMIGELALVPGEFQITVGETALELTRREIDLLELLATEAGKVLTREEIYERVWGYAMVRGDRSVDVYVRKLRQKLESASPAWRYVHTHFGIGYRFEAELVDAGAPMDELVAMSA
jgi:DNA-binding response OmpR family regulator